MTGLLLAALEHLSPRIRRLLVAVAALLALGAIMAALTLTAPRSAHKRHPTPPPPVTSRSPQSPPQRPRPPVSNVAMGDARRVAERFQAGYLPLTYGRGSALAVTSATPALRRQLVLDRGQLTPAERHRHPRVLSLQTVGTTPAFVVATAVIDDGGITPYRLRFALQRAAGRWAVNGVEEG